MNWSDKNVIVTGGKAQFIINWKYKKHWKYFQISLKPYIQLYITKDKDNTGFVFALFGYPFKALIGIDTFHCSKLYPIHSLFWFRFTKMVSGEGTYSRGNC